MSARRNRGLVRPTTVKSWATLIFVRGEGSTVHLATYDDRLAEAAAKLGITPWEG